ncbi:MAG: hypothetical protein JXB49_02605 [Bacteroidales bacterium]|nr:hypothetical protein [Bacteroidales bacterium]
MKALLCLACGASLPSSGICEYCGTAHESDGTLLVEHYARCPICKRNDQVKKVSSILLQEAKILNLPARPSAPEVPKELSIDSNQLIIAVIFTFLALACFVGIFFLGFGMAIFMVFVGIFSIIMWYFYFKEPEDIRKQNEELTNKYNQELSLYKEAKDKYDNSFYCYRDGTIFTYIPRT